MYLYLLHNYLIANKYKALIDILIDRSTILTINFEQQ